MHLKATETIETPLLFDMMIHQPSTLISVQMSRLRSACPGLCNYVRIVTENWNEKMKAALMACISRLRYIPESPFVEIPEISDQEVNKEDFYMRYLDRADFASFLLCLLHGKNRENERETVRLAFNRVHFIIRSSI